MDGGDDLIDILKPVFDSCDLSGDGYVSIDDILSLGMQHSFENLEVNSKFSLIFLISNIFCRYRAIY